MTRHQRFVLTVRWAVVTASLTSAIWGIEYAFHGSVPTAAIPWLPGAEHIRISRWWDILIGPVAAYTALRIRAIPAFAPLPRSFALIATTVNMLGGALIMLVADKTKSSDVVASVCFAAGLSGLVTGTMPIVTKAQAWSGGIIGSFVGAGIIGILAGVPTACITLLACTTGATLGIIMRHFVPIVRTFFRWLTEVSDEDVELDG